MTANLHQRFAALKSGGALPSPQGVALAIARLALRDDVGTSELTRLIKSDPAMAGRLLRYANAAHGGSRRHIASLSQAVVFLGLYRIRQLALAFSLIEVYRTGRCQGFAYDDYWSQSLATGVGAQELCRFAQAPPEDSFTCGLLSGIGRLGFASVYPAEYAAILAGHSTDAALRRAEEIAFGIDHAALSGEMLADWGLPLIFSDAVRYHEDPDAGPYAPGSRAENLARVLNLAAQIAQVLAAADDGRRDDDVQSLYHAAARVGLDAADLAPTIERISELWIGWAGELRLPTRRHTVSELLVEPPTFGRQAALVVMPMRVALIADDPGLLQTLSGWLRDLGQQTIQIDDWRLAAATVRAESPDVLFVDMRAGAIEPARVVREIRQAEAPHHGFFISLVPAAEEALVPELIRAGADDYLLLPPSAAAFEARLHAAHRVVGLQGVVRAEREASIRHSSEWARSNRRLLREALTDPLTQLPNRRYGLDHLTQESVFAGEARLPLACIMLDIDHFKRVNDSFGHEAGDDVLRQFAATVQANCRKNDVVFRYGGEEFCVICPATTAADALGLAERILDATRSTSYLGAGHVLAVTVSAGIATRRHGIETAEALIAAADAALYRAKDSGRDRVAAATDGG